MSWMKYLMILPSRTPTTIPADISLDMCQFIVGADNCLNLAMSPCVEPGCSIRRTSISRSIVHQESQNYLVFFIDNICRIISLCALILRDLIHPSLCNLSRWYCVSPAASPRLLIIFLICTPGLSSINWYTTRLLSELSTITLLS
jgi:hypothetical protein